MEWRRRCGGRACVREVPSLSGCLGNRQLDGYVRQRAHPAQDNARYGLSPASPHFSTSEVLAPLRITRRATTTSASIYLLINLSVYPGAHQYSVAPPESFRDPSCSRMFPGCDRPNHMHPLHTRRAAKQQWFHSGYTIMRRRQTRKKLEARHPIRHEPPLESRLNWKSMR